MKNTEKKHLKHLKSKSRKKLFYFLNLYTYIDFFLPTSQEKQLEQNIFNIHTNMALTLNMSKSKTITCLH